MTTKLETPKPKKTIHNNSFNSSFSNITILIILFFLGLTARKEKEVEIQTKKAQLDEIHKEKEAKRLIKGQILSEGPSGIIDSFSQNTIEIISLFLPWNFLQLPWGFLEAFGASCWLPVGFLICDITY